MNRNPILATVALLTITGLLAGGLAVEGADPQLITVSIVASLLAGLVMYAVGWVQGTEG